MTAEPNGIIPYPAIAHAAVIPSPVNVIVCVAAGVIGPVSEFAPVPAAPDTTLREVWEAAMPDDWLVARAA